MKVAKSSCEEKKCILWKILPEGGNVLYNYREEVAQPEPPLEEVTHVRKEMRQRETGP